MRPNNIYLAREILDLKSKNIFSASPKVCNYKRLFFSFFFFTMPTKQDDILLV